MIKTSVIKKGRVETKQKSFLRAINRKFLNGEIENVLKRMTQKLILRNTVM